MPCQLCSSPLHTLKDCDSQIAMNTFEDVMDIMLLGQFQFQRQIIYLERLSKTILVFICKKLNLVYSQKGKMQLIYSIIEKNFKDSISIEGMSMITSEDIDSIHSEYAYYYHQNSLLPMPISRAQMLPSNIVNMIEDFYMRHYGTYRHGRETGDYLWAIAELTLMEMPDNREDYYDDDYEDNRDIDEIFNVFEANFIVHNNERVEKLDLHIEVDALQDEKECCLCCEVQQHAKLGCDHEMCIDCLFGIANARKKSIPVIKCAFCRADVDIVYVRDEILQQKLSNKIKIV